MDDLRINMEGWRAGSLVLFTHVGAGVWDASCDCGRRVYVRGADVRRGSTSSCGCRANAIQPAADRFWRHVDRSGGPSACWPWLGARLKAGYGVMGRGGAGAGNVLAHRFSYELHHGPIPTKLIVRHKCDNPPCCNPDHLLKGKQRDNIMDSISRGRWNSHKRGHRVLKPAAIRAIRRLYARGVAHKRIADRYRITVGHVSHIGVRRAWKHVA